MKKILVIFGTRPEAIKMAPVISALRAADTFNIQVAVTGQHREMLDQVLDVFYIKVDHDLSVMGKGQTLAELTAMVLTGVSNVLIAWQPDLVLVHGDTLTSLAAAMACFYQRITVGHVEAGLRTYTITSPWPEEFNRRVVGLVSGLHFAPTAQARQNLLNEAIPDEAIYLTGNTVIDALVNISAQIDQDNCLRDALNKKFAFLSPHKRIVLVTAHRRENFGVGINAICDSLRHLALRDDLDIVYPVHLNPNVKDSVERSLSGYENIFLLEPQDYISFVYLMKNCYLVLTDSGGIQEEAPALGKPVLVMRDSTERPEAIMTGTAKLVGANAENIYQHVTLLLDDETSYQQMVNSKNPYGDGTAAQKIVMAIRQYFTGTM